MTSQKAYPQPYVRVLYPWRDPYYPAQVMSPTPSESSLLGLAIHTNVGVTLIQWAPRNNTFHVKVDRRRNADQYVGEEALHRNWEVLYWEYCPSVRDIRIGEVLRLTELEVAQLKEWPVTPIV